MAETKPTLYQYAVLFHPKPTKDERDAGTTPASLVLVEPTTILANSEQEVAMKAARAIDEKYMDKLEDVQVLVRPFSRGLIAQDRAVGSVQNAAQNLVRRTHVGFGSQSPTIGSLRVGASNSSDDGAFTVNYATNGVQSSSFSAAAVLSQ